MAVLDASVLIAYGRGDEAVKSRLDEVLEPDEVLRVPAQAWIEFLVGIPERHRTALARLLTRSIHFVPFDRPLADRAIELQTRLRRSGHRLSWADLSIAVTALHLGERLCTRDGDYDRVAGLEIVRV